jgi:hypothetical protein
MGTIIVAAGGTYASVVGTEPIPGPSRADLEELLV